MFIVYCECKATDEGDPREFVTAGDDIRELNDLDYALVGTECLWIVPTPAPWIA